MTLDIHMPEMTGIEYLEQKLGPSHPPVVMLTSASRDNMDLAQKAMDLGARDYVEKPSLASLTEKADEFRSKIRAVVTVPSMKSVSSLKGAEFDKQFKMSMQIKKTDDKLNILFVDERSVSSLIAVLNDKAFSTVPSVIVAMGDLKQIDLIFAKLVERPELKNKVVRMVGGKLTAAISFAGFDDFKRHAVSISIQKTICYSCLSNLSRSQWDGCPKSKVMKILLTEEVDRGVFLTYLPSIFVTPPTSFAYMANEFFGKFDVMAA
jgi:chemotaxis protein methyltransferase CheR